MRYRNLFIICLFLSLSTSNARNANNTDCSNVTAETAKMKAEAFLSRKFSSMTRGENRELQLARRDAGYYAFNIGNDEGYIIVSGDERTNDIIGYSYHGHFDLSEMPYSLRRWMRGYSHVIQNLSKNATRAEHKNRPAIETLIKTHWGQNGVYGRQCPRVKNPDDPNSPEYETPAGCVATAMAQIINFYQWPKTLPELPEYTTGTLHIFRPALPATTINYDILRPIYRWEDNDESVDEVNKLLVYCGQSCQMDYTPSGSGSGLTVETMAKFWGYTKKARPVNRSSYSTVDAWEDEIYEELAAGHPVPYAGVDMNEAHQFICDGYDGEGFFHLNFGWEGQDGYFDLSLCNHYCADDNEYISDNGFVSSQAAILGLVPTTADENDVQIEYDNREAVNGEIRVNSIEPVGVAHAHYFSLYKLNVTGLSDVEQTVFYVIPEGNSANMMTVYLKKGETRDIFVHARCMEPGVMHVIVASDPDGKHILTETDVTVIEDLEKYRITTITEIPDMKNGIISGDVIKAVLTIANESDKQFDDEYRFVLSVSHAEDETLVEYRSFDTVLHLAPNETTQLEVVFNHIRPGIYMTNPYYWSNNLQSNSNENKWIEVVNGTGIHPISIISSKTKIYDMRGRRLDRVHKGINIIVTADGNTKKVVVR